MSIFKRRKFYLLICGLFLFQSSTVVVNAKDGAENWQDNLSVDVFFSVDASIVNNDFFVVGSNGPVLLEAEKISFKHSLIGGQLRYQVTDNLSVYVQGSASDSEGPNSHIDWAYISYDFGSDLSARLGRFQIPFLQGTELRKVGFSRLWVRPLIPGTGASGYNQYSGIELIKKYISGKNNWEFQAAIGEAQHQSKGVSNKNIKLISGRYQRDDFWIRTALMQGESSITSSNGLVLADSAFISMVSVESQWLKNNWLLNMGYSTSDVDISPNDSMQYVSLGYQFDTLTPFVYFSKINQFFEPVENLNRDTTSNNQGPPPAPPSSGREPFDGDSKTYSSAVGVRWNMADRLALKVQVEKLRIEDEARTGPQNRSNSGTALSVVLEGVF